MVYVATVEFRFGADVLTEKLVFDKSYETTGVGGSNLGIHGCYSLHRRSNTVSLETYPLYSLKVFFRFV